MSTLKNRFNQILSSRIDGYRRKHRREICGVPVSYKEDGFGGSSWEDWQDILQDVLPKFEEADLLDGLNSIILDGDRFNGNAGKYYSNFRMIEIETNPKLGWRGEFVLGTGNGHILMHELIHHAHFVNGGFALRHEDFDSDYAKMYVSYYAGKNPLEFVAETGAGIIQGYEFPDRIHTMYDEYYGPQEVYDF